MNLDESFVWIPKDDRNPVTVRSKYEPESFRIAQLIGQLPSILSTNNSMPLQASWPYKTPSVSLLPRSSLSASSSSLCKSHEEHKVEVSSNMPVQVEQERVSSSNYYSVVVSILLLGLWELRRMGISAVGSPRRQLHSSGCAERPLSSLRGRELQEVCDQDHAARPPSLPGSAGPGSRRVRPQIQLEALDSMRWEHVRRGRPLRRAILLCFWGKGWLLLLFHHVTHDYNLIALALPRYLQSRLYDIDEIGKTREWNILSLKPIPWILPDMYLHANGSTDHALEITCVPKGG